MIISLGQRVLQKPNFISVLGKEAKALSVLVQPREKTPEKSNDNERQTNEKAPNFASYRHIYPEFLPDPNPLHRNSIREKLERMDMLARRSVLSIPEFYVGSVLAVTYSEPHATGKTNRFVGICILREGCGLRASFILRNIVNGEGVEVRYNLYDPAIQKVDCLRLEKRLDNELLYLRDAPPEYSTFSFDMEPEITPPGFVPLNEVKVPLNPLPWSQKWELKNMKGVQDFEVPERRRKRAAANAKPWEKYDLMKTYRETIPEEEQAEIFSDLRTELRELEVRKNILKRKRMLERKKKI